jgi:hypothetical protein
MVLPLLPFLVIYLVVGVRAAFRPIARALRAGSDSWSWKVAAVAVTGVLLVNLYGNIEYIGKRYGKGRVDWIENFEEHKMLLDWMRDHLSNGDAVATNNPPLVYLFTGLKTVSIDSPAENWERWRRLGVRYLVPSPPWEAALPPELSEGRLDVVHLSAGRLRIPVSDLGPVAARPPWSTLPR